MKYLECFGGGASSKSDLSGFVQLDGPVLSLHLGAGGQLVASHDIFTRKTKGFGNLKFLFGGFRGGANDLSVFAKADVLVLSQRLDACGLWS